MKTIATYTAVVLLALIAAFLMLALVFNVMDKQKARQDRQELNEYWMNKRQWQKKWISAMTVNGGHQQQQSLNWSKS